MKNEMSFSDVAGELYSVRQQESVNVGLRAAGVEPELPRCEKCKKITLKCKCEDQDLVK